MNEPRKLYIADWHYGHANCIYFDARPFKDVEEMNKELVRRWNEAVNLCDTVYVLGDMFWCKGEEAIAVLKQLNGNIILVKGNHDRCHDNRFAREFAKIDDYLEVDDNGRKIVLSHYPIPCYKNHFYGWLHLYGHVHTSFEWNMMEHNKYLMEELYTRPCEMYNTGAMLPYMDYTPRTLDEIIEGYKQMKGKKDEQE
jgi:calcineurin-like phosphoesterase family protein